jgi:hypothetical protein
LTDVSEELIAFIFRAMNPDDGGSKREEVRGRQSKLSREENSDFSSSLNMIRLIKSRRLRLAVQQCAGKCIQNFSSKSEGRNE